MPETPLSEAAYQSAGGNLGANIGLGGVVPQFRDVWLEGQRNKRLQEEKAREAKDKSLEKWGQYLDIKGVHRLDMDEANSIFTTTFDDLVKNYDSYSQTVKQKKLMEAQMKIAGLQARGKDLEAAETQLRAIANSRNIGAPEAEMALGSMTRQGATWDDVQKNSDWQTGIVKADATNKTILVNPIPNFDIQGAFKRIINTPSYMTEPTGKTVPVTYTGADGKVVVNYEPEYRIPDEKIEGAARVFLTQNQAGVDTYQYNLKSKLPQEYWTQINSSDPNERAKAFETLVPYVAEDMRTMAGTKKRSITVGEKPQGRKDAGVTAVEKINVTPMPAGGLVNETTMRRYYDQYRMDWANQSLQEQKIGKNPSDASYEEYWKNPPTDLELIAEANRMEKSGELESHTSFVKGWSDKYGTEKTNRLVLTKVGGGDIVPVQFVTESGNVVSGTPGEIRQTKTGYEIAFNVTKPTEKGYLPTKIVKYAPINDNVNYDKNKAWAESFVQKKYGKSLDEIFADKFGSKKAPTAGGVKKDEMIEVTNPKGARVKIKQSQLEQALKQGYKK